MEPTIENLLLKVSNYNIAMLPKVRQAYEMACSKHCGIFRESGEEYITHPLSVALILAEYELDEETIVASLLHDVVEDTKTPIEEIASLFGETVAKLVEGVTKLSKLEIPNENVRIATNTRKIVLSLEDDCRIIHIKLADRLHNMRTLQYRSIEKQKEVSKETMHLYVPMANYIGAYRIKCELEDLSFRYLNQSEFNRVFDIREQVAIDSAAILQEMLSNIYEILNMKGIHPSIKSRVKNVYGIYKRLSSGHQIGEIHDLLSLKIMTDEIHERLSLESTDDPINELLYSKVLNDEINDCYVALRYIHSLYHPANVYFKDYIASPKPNMYQALHSTLFGPADRLVQAQISTARMGTINSSGLMGYSILGKTASDMQEDLNNRFAFFRRITDMKVVSKDVAEFNNLLGELLTDTILVYTSKGEIIELPLGSTPIDFAYQIHSDIGNHLSVALVNNLAVPPGHQLQNNDRVRIITSLDAKPKLEWTNYARTRHARDEIGRELRREELKGKQRTKK